MSTSVRPGTSSAALLASSYTTIKTCNVVQLLRQMVTVQCAVIYLKLHAVCFFKKNIFHTLFSLTQRLLVICIKFNKFV